MKPEIQYFAEADVQRRIRQTRRLRVAAFFAAALNALMLAVNGAGGSLLNQILAPFSASAVIACLALIVWQTRMIGTLRRRERELSRPRMTPEDWRRLRELEIGLGWEPSEPPADEIAARAALADRMLAATMASVSACECGHCDGSHEGPAMGWFRDTRRPAPGEGEGAPMTGPGGRWRPVSELFERDAQAAEHFAGLASVGRESCIDPCSMCAERDTQATSGAMRRIDEWIEKGRWEQ